MNADGTDSLWYYKRKLLDGGEQPGDKLCTYPFGVDPVWGLSSQRLQFTNNIKMKLSVIYGVLHMSMGIVHKGANTLYKKDYLGFVFEVVGGLVILIFLFGWMDFLIYGKWFFDFVQYDSRVTTVIKGKNHFIGDLVNQRSPSVINILINTVFGGG